MGESKSKMYSERKGNIAVFRGCDFSCEYCNFRTSLRRSSCQQCRDFIPHSHMEVLRKNPPIIKPGEFITIGLSGDISFMTPLEFYYVMEYCLKWNDRTFMIQSKNPAYFKEFQENSPYKIPDNVILGTTMETNRTINISKAPNPELRIIAMTQLKSRKEITIEPIMRFDMTTILGWMNIIKPEFIYIGYNSKNNVQLPEPKLAETKELIQRLRDDGHDVREKMMRKAWYE